MSGEDDNNTSFESSHAIDYHTNDIIRDSIDVANLRYPNISAIGNSRNVALNFDDFAGESEAQEETQQTQDTQATRTKL